MNLYNVTSSVNGIVFKFTDDDLSNFNQTLQERLDSKIEVYGNNPIVVIEDISDIIKKKKQDEAHKAAWQYIYDSGHDQGGLMQFINWKFDSLTSQAAKDKISAIETWKDAVMALYFSKKAAIWNNQPYDLDYSSAGVCPFSFTEVMESI